MPLTLMSGVGSAARFSSTETVLETLFATAKRLFKKLPVGKCHMIRLGHGTPKTLSHRCNRHRMGLHRTLCTRDQAGRATGELCQARNPERHLVYPAWWVCLAPAAP